MAIGLRWREICSMDTQPLRRVAPREIFVAWTTNQMEGESYVEFRNRFSGTRPDCGLSGSYRNRRRFLADRVDSFRRVFDFVRGVVCVSRQRNTTTLI